jgi:hypothetical protein
MPMMGGIANTQIGTKCRRKTLYAKLRKYLGKVFRK